jgi:hypothetical protein
VIILELIRSSHLQVLSYFSTIIFAEYGELTVHPPLLLLVTHSNSGSPLTNADVDHGI